MKNVKRIFSLFLVLILLSGAVSCKGKSSSSDTSKKEKKADSSSKANCPLLWRATDEEGREIYFFGTIHIGDKNNKEVLKRLKPYLEKCDALAVEFDTEAYEKDLKQQQSDLQLFIYEDGTTVEDHISEELYTKMKDFLKDEKQYNRMYEYCSPALWEMLISQNLAEKSGLSFKKAMDTLLLKDAYSANREILEVESANMQYRLIAGVPDEYYSIAIKSELEKQDDYINSIKTLHKKWLKGDQKDIMEFLEKDEYEGLTEEEKKQVEDYNRVIVVERNLAMAQKAQEYVESGKKVFFAVGTMHFLGDDGIVELLKQEGFKFERVYY